MPKVRERYVIYNTIYNTIPKVVQNNMKIVVRAGDKTFTVPVPPTGIPIAHVTISDVELSTIREYRVLTNDMLLKYSLRDISMYFDIDVQNLLTMFGYTPGLEGKYIWYENSIYDVLANYISRSQVSVSLDTYDDMIRYRLLEILIEKYFELVSAGVIPKPPDPAWVHKRLLPFADMIIRDKYGFRVFEVFFLDSNVEDLFVNGYNTYILLYHRKWRKCRSSVYVTSSDVGHFAERLKLLFKRVASHQRPFIDYQIPGVFNIRVNANFDPLAVDGVNMTMRKNLETPIPLPYMVFTQSMKVMDLRTASLLFEVVHRGGSAIFVGRTGSGKTTLLKAVLFTEPHYRRIISLEDTVEIPDMRKWGYDHVRLSARSPLTKIKEDELDLEKAAKVPLRMRPNVFVLGEVRGKEAGTLFEILQMGTAAVFSTAHGRSPQSIIRRFVQHLGVEPSAIADLDLIVQLAQLDVPGFETTRRVVEVSLISEREKRVSGLKEGEKVMEVSTGAETVEILLSPISQYVNNGITVDKNGNRVLDEEWKVDVDRLLNSDFARRVRIETGISGQKFVDELNEKYNVLRLLGEIMKYTNNFDTIFKYTSFVVEAYYYYKDMVGLSDEVVIDSVITAINTHSKERIGIEVKIDPEFEYERAF